MIQTQLIDGRGPIGGIIITAVKGGITFMHAYGGESSRLTKGAGRLRDVDPPVVGSVLRWVS